MKRIFIMSSERSGSNLLRQIIGMHTEMIAPTAIHFTTNLAKWFPFYQSKTGLADKQLIRDMLDLAAAHIAPWHYSIKIDRVRDAIEQYNFWGVFIALYDTLADMQAKSGWICKDNALFDFASEILNFYPDSKFIYLVRDGRDVALSFRKMPTGPKTIYDAASLWTTEQQACLRVATMHPQAVRIVRYEDLLRHPTSQVKSICEFAELQYSDQMLTSLSDPLGMSKRSIFWKNLNKQLMTENYGKWRKMMKRRDVRYYQSVLNGETKGILKLLGYDVVGIDLSFLRIKIRRLCDYGLNIFYFLKNIIESPEKHARRPKKQALALIRNRLISRNFDSWPRFG